MAALWAWVQYVLGKVLSPIRGHDSKLMTNHAAFKHLPSPNMQLKATEYGASGSLMFPSHTCLAEDKMGGLPDFTWVAPENTDVKEYILLCEDPDVPIPGLCLPHGLFYGIPPSVCTATNTDIMTTKKIENHVTDAGWKYIPNLRGVPYIGAGAPLGHGVHRYFFTIVALDTALDFEGFDGKINQGKIREAIQGKVVGWGQWIGNFERPWPR
ncbi:hypothetical protein FE257_010969 [Aspergillus nanangensis]|uniref:Uncharacterized protein n=1 Tax=Aspergillus nanangensis TaxID=2582783 RepID=A0AAD4CXR9_ASPNN|nr:hypothetical protein FE257_010969 [Aspergillus nanangensis]